MLYYMFLTEEKIHSEETTALQLATLYQQGEEVFGELSRFKGVLV